MLQTANAPAEMANQNVTVRKNVTAKNAKTKTKKKRRNKFFRTGASEDDPQGPFIF